MICYYDVLIDPALCSRLGIGSLLLPLLSWGYILSDVMRHRSCPYSRWHRLIFGLCLLAIFHRFFHYVMTDFVGIALLTTLFLSLVAIGVAAINPLGRLMLLLSGLVFLVSSLGAWLVSHHARSQAYLTVVVCPSLLSLSGTVLMRSVNSTFSFPF